MTWTYVPDFTGQRDRVRAEIGDTISTDQLLSDEEIAYFGSVEPDDLSAAAHACEAIAGALGRKVDMQEGKLSIKLSQRRLAYEMKARRLRARAAAGAGPYIGGESIADKENTNEDTDRVAPAFYRGMLDNPNATQPTPLNEGNGDPQAE